jgi:translation initiation factor IF-2
MLQNRPPIVVILGHVDHGKTTLLDYLRKSNIASLEAGGITQSTRAFQVGGCTFIDTPGHAAFANMRLRGKNIADLAVLIVAGDDGVMPQTKESAQILLSSQTPFVVAVNKTDLPGVNMQKIYGQLAEINVLVEGFGGTVPIVPISAKTGLGIPELLEMLNLLASLTPPQSDDQAVLEAAVLESRLDAKRGPMAIVVVKNGTLKEGMGLFTNHGIGKARALTTTTGENVKQATAAMPVEILGLSEVVPVGHIISSEVRKSNLPIHKTRAGGIIKIILKTDVLGSLEAIENSLDSRVEVLLSGTGEVTETDVLTAAPLEIPIINFNTRIPSSVAKIAETEKVKIKSFTIIYELLDYVSNLIEKTLNPRAAEKNLGEATIVAIFDMNGDHIAGCKCTVGQIAKSDSLHLMRNGEVIQDMKFRSLKSGKSDINLVKSGTDFGAVFSGKVDFQKDDRIIAFTIHD